MRAADHEEIYIRLGSTSRRANREQQAALFAAGGTLRAEALPVSGSGLSSLSRSRLKNYLRDILREPVLPAACVAYGIGASRPKR